MESNQNTLKTRGKRMQSRGIFSVNLTCFILTTLLTLNFEILPISADKSGKDDVQESGDPFSLKLIPISVKFDNELASKWIDVKIPDKIKPMSLIPSIGFGNVFTLLKNMYVQFTAINNKPIEENKKIKSQNEVIKNEFADLLKDLKGQMTSLSNQQKEIQSTLESRNLSSSISSASAVLTDPQFYILKQFKGPLYTPSSDVWKRECVNLPFPYWSSSVKSGGHCLFVCAEKDCNVRYLFNASCQTINGTEVGNIQDIGFDYHHIRSFHKC